MGWIWRALGSVNGRRRSVSEAVETATGPTHGTLRMDEALSYATRLTLAQQRARLNTVGPYIWVDRDSHWYPDYISTRCYPDYGFFKIFDVVDGRFNLTIKLVADHDVVEDELAKLLVQARELVLAAIDATDIERAEPYD
jgi:hypothetical protein